MVKVDIIHTNFVYGHFFPNVPIGWEIYPLTYKNKRYVIRMKFDTFDIENVSLRINFYEFKDKKKFFVKHRGNHICEIKHSGRIKVDDDTLLDLMEFYTGDLIFYLPKISKALFEEMERKLENSKKTNLIVDGVCEWDGVVELVKEQPTIEVKENCGRDYVEQTGKCPMCINCPHDCPLDKS